MKKLILSVFLSFMLFGCNQPLTVSKANLMEITKHWKEPKVAIWYYTGSDAEYHYFRFTDLGDTKEYRVKREEMQIDTPLTKKQKDWRVMPWGPMTNGSHHPARSGVTIFMREANLKPPYKIEVDEVEVVQETDYSLILDVSYTYQDEIPNEEVKLFVLPNMSYWATNSIPVERGSHVGRVSIDLYEKKMKEDQVYQYETSKLTISFDHYAPEKYKGSIYNEIVPFIKVWKIRKERE